MRDAFGIAGAGMDLTSLLRARVVELLKCANTLAGAQVEACRDAAITGAEPFHIGVFTPKISRDEIGNAPPGYKATVTLLITGKVTHKLLDDAVLLSDTLRVQIEQAVLCSTAFWMPPLENVKSIETTMHFPGDDDIHQGFMAMLLECICTDTFYPRPGQPLQEIHVVIPNPTIAQPDENIPADNLIGSDTILPQE